VEHEGDNYKLPMVLLLFTASIKLFGCCSKQIAQLDCIILDPFFEYTSSEEVVDIIHVSPMWFYLVNVYGFL
jgi:hypothetical protein